MSPSFSRYWERARKPWNRLSPGMSEGTKPRQDHRCVVNVKMLVGHSNEMSQLMRDVKTKESCKLTTGGTCGIGLDPDSLDAAHQHAARLTESEFGLLCLWSRKTGVLIVVRDVRGFAVEHLQPKVLILRPVVGPETVITILYFESAEDLQAVRASLSHQQSQ